MENEESILGGIDINIFKYDIRVLFITVKRRFFFLLLVPLLTASLAFCYVAFYKKKAWIARCMLFRHTNLERLEGQIPNIYKPIDTKVIIEMIRTRKNMREVIRRLKLKTSVNSLYGKTDVEMEEKNDNIINIFAQSRSPQEAADVANTLAEVFVEEYVKMQNSAVQKTYDYYLRSKNEVEGKLKILSSEQQEYLKKYNVISISTETEGKFKQLNEIELNMLQAKMQETALAIKIKNIESDLKTMKKEVRLSYTVSRTDTNELENKRTELYQMRQKYTDENPRIKKLLSEIKYIEAKVKAQKGREQVPEKVTYGGNQVRASLEDLRVRTIGELSAVKQNIKQYQQAIVALKNDLGKLSKIENRFFNIKRQIELNRDLLKQIDNMVSILKFSLQSSVSDITIMERAEPPTTPSVKRRRITIVIGGIAGFFLALGVIILSELVDFTIKSRFDIENVLRIKILGSLPMMNQVKLQTFYSAVQVIYKRIFEMTSNSTMPVLVTFGDVEEKSGKTFFIKKCIDVFNPQEKKILYISTVDDLSPNLRKYVINDYIYKDEVVDIELAAENNNRLYFMLDDYTYIAPADKIMIQKFVNKFKGNYDFVFWELFDFYKNEQLFVTICEAAALTVVMTRFRKSNKFGLLKCINFLREHEIESIGGVLNCVEKKYFDKGI
jgi:capsular polysaccharide biosynthesis protein